MKKSILKDYHFNIIIINFFNFDLIDRSIFDNIYYPNLQDQLLQKKIPYTYFPKHYKLSKNPFKAKNVLNFIKSRNKNFLSIYELLTFFDLIEIAFLSIMDFFGNIKTLIPFSKVKIDQAFNMALIEKLDDPNINKFIYYVGLKKITKLCNNSKVILWYENQAIDKCIIKALRTNPSIEVYAAQFSLIIPQEMNLFPSQYEIETNLCPDYIYTTQNESFFKIAKERYRQGIGLRYVYLEKYNLPIENSKAEFALLLSSFEDRNVSIFNILKKVNISRLAIKKHPVLQQTTIPQIFNWNEINDFTEKILLDHEIIISADSGVIFEAMAMGRQVIIIGSDDEPSFYIPPIQFKNKLWSHVTNKESFLENLNLLKYFKLHNLEELCKLAYEVRELYFNSSKKSILEIFDIK
jgi:hypothetical protein